MDQLDSDFYVEILIKVTPVQEFDCRAKCRVSEQLMSRKLCNDLVQGDAKKIGN